MGGSPGGQTKPGIVSSFLGEGATNQYMFCAFFDELLDTIFIDAGSILGAILEQLCIQKRVSKRV